MSIEKSEEKSDLPPFKLGTDLYDRTTFNGRLQHFSNVIDPRSLLKSEDDIRIAENILKISATQYEGGIIPGKSNKEMWDAQLLVQSAVHPDTGDIIPRPFRMSGYVPFNAPILVGLLVPQGTVMTAFWQWLNQTHNALVNYSNRNAKTPVTTAQQVTGYSIAVGSAMGISYACNKYLKNNAKKMNPRVAAVASAMVPFSAVAVASCLNTAAMRNAELSTGIDVFDAKTGEVYGVSKNAATEAIKLTCISRVAISAGCLMAPPIVIAGLQGMGVIHPITKYRSYLLAQTVVCTLCFLLILPRAIAIFPQYGTLPREALEPEIQEKLKADYVTYNKGL